MENFVSLDINELNTINGGQNGQVRTSHPVSVTTDEAVAFMNGFLDALFS